MLRYKDDYYVRRYGKSLKVQPIGKEWEGNWYEGRSGLWVQHPRYCHPNKDDLQRWLGPLDTSTFVCSLLFKGSYLVSCCQCSLIRKTLTAVDQSQAKHPGKHVSFFFLPQKLSSTCMHSPPFLSPSLEGSWSLPWMSASPVLTALGKECKMHRLIKNLKGNLTWISSMSEDACFQLTPLSLEFQGL